MSDAQTRSISPENPTGEKGKGAMIVPTPGDPDQPFAGMFVHLGRGWKSRPFVNLKAGESRTLMDVSGSGVIQMCWITPEPFTSINVRDSPAFKFTNGRDFQPRPRWPNMLANG